ncbi:urease accessory protein UreF [Rhodovibrionaceae bacterium A322]
MTDRGHQIQLQRLMTWMSPAFPVGAYTYSHGLEWEVEQGRVTDKESLLLWLEAVLELGTGRNDALFCAEAWHSVREGNEARLSELLDLALAYTPSQERLLETEAQGQAFWRAVSAGWPDLAADPSLAILLKKAPYPLAVGGAAARAGLPLGDTLAAYLHGLTANLISAGVRLVPLGQSDGVRCLADCEDRIAALAGWAGEAGLEELGGFTPLVDIASMAHETQYTRLFRS